MTIDQEIKQIDEMAKAILNKNHNRLTSFENVANVLAFIGLQQTFFRFLVAVRAIKGLEIKVNEDMTTSIVFKGKELPESRKIRFQKPDELRALLYAAQLTN